MIQSVQENKKNNRFINIELLPHYNEYVPERQIYWYTAIMRLILIVLLALAMAFLLPVAVEASVDNIGIHLLHPQEIEQVRELFSEQNTKKDQLVYVTIPYTIADTKKTTEWQNFFKQASELNVIPLIRLTTSFEKNSWQVPSRNDVVSLLDSLDGMEWPQTTRHIIVFNEVNHAKEWGGAVTPREYASILEFTANWAHTQSNTYVVLPAALDLSAPQSGISWDAYAYWQAVYRENPEIFTVIDGWNSHSYPNPAFSAAPGRTGRTSLQGYKQELVWLTQWTEKELPVYITETGWEINRTTIRYLQQYYTYAFQHIWSDERVVAVTPFVLKGEPGPFANFSFLTGDDKPTVQYLALQRALKQMCGSQCPQSLSLR